MDRQQEQSGDAWEPRQMLEVRDRVCATCSAIVPHALLEGWRTGRRWWEAAGHGADGKPRGTGDADRCNGGEAPNAG